MLNLDSFSAGFLQTGQSYKFGFSELEVYKAVAGDLTNPANSSHSLMAKIRAMNVSKTIRILTFPKI